MVEDLATGITLAPCSTLEVTMLPASTLDVAPPLLWGRLCPLLPCLERVAYFSSHMVGVAYHLALWWLSFQSHTLPSDVSLSSAMWGRLIMEGDLSCSGYAVGFAPREPCQSTGQCWVKDASPRGPGFMLGCVLHVESCMLKGGSVWVVWDYSAHQPLHITWACCMTSLSTQLFLVLDLISTLYFKPHFQCISQACLL